MPSKQSEPPDTSAGYRIDVIRHGLPASPPQVSVIIPTINRCQVLKEAVRALQTQSLKEIEIIVVDNGPSTDGTYAAMMDLVKQDPRIIYVVTDLKGLAHARNIGCRQASTEILIVQDDDWEVIHPETLEFVVGRFSSCERIGVLGLRSVQEVHYASNSKRARLQQLLYAGGLIKPGRITRWGKVDGNLHLLSSSHEHQIDHVRGCFLAFRKEVASRVGFFPSLYVNKGDDFRSETEFCVRIARLGFHTLFVTGFDGSHKGSPRTKGVISRKITPEKTFHVSRNHSLFVLRNYWSPRSARIFFVWDFLVGTSRSQPGLIQILTSRRNFLRPLIIGASLHGKMAAYREYFLRYYDVNITS
jgi:glycosyltransferase involved in cell wall biosynthesis